MASELGAVCVTGGCGFLGKALVAQLLEEGHHVCVADLIDRPETLDSRVKYAKADLRDPDQVFAAIRGANTVFHVASVIDMSPCPGPLMEEVNVHGTNNVIAACQKAGVKHLVYTSSIDVTFDGEDITNGDESMPFPETPLTGYIGTKGAAERAVRAANSTSMRTACIRPAHIYGPGDAMITEVIKALVSGSVPFKFACGQNDYVYVDNCAHAHLLCAKALARNAPGVAGEAFFVNDYHSDMWSHVTPYLEACKVKAPTANIPVGVVSAFAYVQELVSRGSFLLSGRTPTSPVTRYSILAVSRDFYFDSSRIVKTLAYKPRVSREEAQEKTLAWVRSLGDVSKGTKGPGYGGLGATRPLTPLEQLHAAHLSYGTVMFFIGCLAFLFPERFSFLMGVPTAPRPDPTAVLAQTTAIIVAVLGSYSMVSSLHGWGAAFHVIVGAAQLLTSIFALGLFGIGKLPVQFGVTGLLQLGFALLSLVLATKADPDWAQSLKLKTSVLTAAQLAHGVFSGLFTGSMLLIPSIVVPLVIPEVGDNPSAGVLAWGHALGFSEIVMSIIYPASGLFPVLRPFAVLSVFSRLAVLFVLFVSAMIGSCAMSQFYGCLADGVLAVFTWYALAVTNPKRTGKAKSD